MRAWLVLAGLALAAPRAFAQAPTPLLPPPLPPNAAPPPVEAPASPVPGAAPAITPPPSAPAGAGAGTAAAGPSAAGAPPAGVAPNGSAPGTPGVSASGHPLPPPTPAPPALTWQAGHMAHVQVLDKVNGQATLLAIGVGDTGHYRTLSLTVRACYARPPDQAPDATALIVARRTGAATPIFAGWLLAAEPTASMVSDPVYDLRVTACT